jgi:hypothetical protein
MPTFENYVRPFVLETSKWKLEDRYCLPKKKRPIPPYYCETNLIWLDGPFSYIIGFSGKIKCCPIYVTIYGIYE